MQIELERALLTARVSDALRSKDLQRLAHMSTEEIQQLDLGEISRMLQLDKWAALGKAFKSAGQWVGKTAKNVWTKVKEVGKKVVKTVEDKMCNGENCWKKWGGELLKHGANFVKNAATCAIGKSKEK